MLRFFSNPAAFPAFIIAVTATGCIQLDPVASERLATGAASSSTVESRDTFEPKPRSAIISAMKNPSRRPVDSEQDERRRAPDVLSFFGIDKGMTVLDMYSGGGYYAELMSYIVGPTGRVVAHNIAPLLGTVGDEVADRYAGDRLKNVEQLIVENSRFELEPETFDAIIMIKAYHDTYSDIDGMAWNKADRSRLVREMFAALKPGGVLGIVDHAANPGAPPRTGGTLHRIDPELIMGDMAVAGFVYAGEIDVLRNPTDDRTESVFAPAVRYRTDRVVLRFRKPAHAQTD